MQTVVVTGGSSGIGEATALRFARRGDWAILLAGKTPAKIDRVSERCRAITRAPIDTVVGDIRFDQVEQEIIRKAAALGQIRAIVNSAGLGRLPRCWKQSLKCWLKCSKSMCLPCCAYVN
jgi:dehydrogenase/reductase SDR family member 7